LKARLQDQIVQQIMVHACRNQSSNKSLRIHPLKARLQEPLVKQIVAHPAIDPIFQQIVVHPPVESPTAGTNRPTTRRPPPLKNPTAKADLPTNRGPSTR
jgi:hypothetical protein